MSLMLWMYRFCLSTTSSLYIGRRARGVVAVAFFKEGGVFQMRGSQRANRTRLWEHRTDRQCRSLRHTPDVTIVFHSHQ